MAILLAHPVHGMVAFDDIVEGVVVEGVVVDFNRELNWIEFTKESNDK